MTTPQEALRREHPVGPASGSSSLATSLAAILGTTTSRGLFMTTTVRPNISHEAAALEVAALGLAELQQLRCGGQVGDALAHGRASRSSLARPPFRRYATGRTVWRSCPLLVG